MERGLAAVESTNGNPCLIPWRFVIDGYAGQIFDGLFDGQRLVVPNVGLIG